MPLLLGAAGQAVQPDQTIQRLLDLVAQIQRRSVYLALLVENPLALSQLVRLSSASPWISDFLKQYPLLLDELLDPRSLYAPPARHRTEAVVQRTLDGIPATLLAGAFRQADFVLAVLSRTTSATLLSPPQLRRQVLQARVAGQPPDHHHAGRHGRLEERSLRVEAIDHHPQLLSGLLVSHVSLPSPPSVNVG